MLQSYAVQLLHVLFIPYVKWVIKVCVLYNMDNDENDDIFYSLHHLLKLNIYSSI